MSSVRMDLIEEFRSAARSQPTMDGRTDPAPPASPEEVREFEIAFGYALPLLWRRVYTEVGNGGFGPGYGILGLISSAVTDLGESALPLYQTLRGPDPEDPEWEWPEGLLPVCHWGCAIHSCIDLRSAAAPVVRFDPNGRGSYDGGWEGAWRLESESSEAWLRAWTRASSSSETGSRAPRHQPRQRQPPVRHRLHPTCAASYSSPGWRRGCCFDQIFALR